MTKPYPADVASRLAADVRAAPKFPSGDFSCAMDDASTVDLYFVHPGASRSELAAVGLTACSAIGAPGRSDRRATDALARDLAELAPAAWTGPLRGRA